MCALLPCVSCMLAAAMCVLQQHTRYMRTFHGNKAWQWSCVCCTPSLRACARQANSNTVKDCIVRCRRVHLQVEYGRATQPEYIADTLGKGLLGSGGRKQMLQSAKQLDNRVSAFNEAFEFSLGEIRREGDARQRLEEQAKSAEDLRVRAGSGTERKSFEPCLHLSHPAGVHSGSTVPDITSA